MIQLSVSQLSGVYCISFLVELAGWSTYWLEASLLVWEVLGLVPGLVETEAVANGLPLL